MALARLPVLLVVATLFALATSSTAHAQASSSGVYALDQASSDVSFTVYASALFKIKREGHFKDVAGELAYDPGSPSATRIDLTIFTDSVDMHNVEHDRLLKSDSFFDVDHFPTMHFASSSADVKPDGSLEITGDMTIRGVTRRMTIPVSLPHAGASASESPGTFESTFQIDRTEFGLNGVPSIKGFSVSISKKVQIHIAIAPSGLIGSMR